MPRPTKWVVSPEFPQGISVELTDEEIVRQDLDRTRVDEKSLMERLSAIVDQLPVEVQAQFAAQLSAVYVALQTERVELAQFLINQVTVTEELLAIKAALLQEFNVE